MAPLLSASSFMGFGASDGKAFANANVSSDWQSAVSEWREASSDNNWAWGNRFMRDPRIRSLAPDEGPVGTEVTLRGARFTDDSIVHMGNEAIEDVEVSRNGRLLTFTVPDATSTNELTPGDYEIRVVNDDERTSNSVTFTVTEEKGEEPGELAIASIDGPTHLTYGQEGTWTVNVNGAEGDLRYSVKWGDEGFGLRSLMSAFADGQTSATFTHTYEESGTYTPEFTVTDEEGNEVTTLAAKVTVGDDGDVLHIETITPASAEAGQEVKLSGSGFDGETKVSVGSQVISDVEVENDSTLTFMAPALSVGDYQVLVTSDEGDSNTVAFSIKTESDTEVSVSGLNAPTKLSVGQEGTWTVLIGSNADGNLRYSVDWGEYSMMLRAQSDESTQSSATFTHSYDEPGTYHPKFTVTDEDGNSASASASVVVK